LTKQLWHFENIPDKTRILIPIRKQAFLYIQYVFKTKLKQYVNKHSISLEHWCQQDKETNN